MPDPGASPRAEQHVAAGDLAHEEQVTGPDQGLQVCVVVLRAEARASFAARKGGYRRFRDFVLLDGLIPAGAQLNKRGESKAHRLYMQAASVIWFLRDSEWSSKRFQNFIHDVGTAPSNLAGINAALRSSLGAEVDIDRLEHKWVEYWKRK